MQIQSPSFYGAILLTTCIIGYAFYNSAALRRGPVIEITSPAQYSSTTQLTVVRGRINKAQEVTINNMPITFNKRGEFVAEVVLTPPLDTIDIQAKSAYGAESKKSIQVAVTE
jgi:hypothetical protein